MYGTTASSGITSSRKTLKNHRPIAFKTSNHGSQRNALLDVTTG
jgi:hypothetical protein